MTARTVRQVLQKYALCATYRHFHCTDIVNLSYCSWTDCVHQSTENSSVFEPGVNSLENSKCSTISVCLSLVGNAYRTVHSAWTL